MPNYENGAETKRKILAAATTLFIQKGYDATTYADICAMTGVNQGSIYYHYRKKIELFYQVQQNVGAVNALVAEQICPQDAPASYSFLLDIFIFWFRFFSDEGFRRLMSDALIGIPAIELTVDDNFSAYWDRCRDFIGDYDTFLKNHELELRICMGADSTLCAFYQDKTDRFSFRDAAEYQIRFYALMFRMHKDICDQTLEKLNAVFTSDILEQIPFLLEKAHFNV